MILSVGSMGQWRRGRVPGVIGISVQRGTVFGNPYVVGPACTLEQAVDAYKVFLAANPILALELALRIKDRLSRPGSARGLYDSDAEVRLLCGSAHQPCHAIPLAQAVAGELRKRWPRLAVTLAWEQGRGASRDNQG